MCVFKSGIILKDKIFIPDYDHHTDMLKELNIEDNSKNAQSIFVRAELIPQDNNVFSDIATWRFNVDQDIVPDWFVKDYEKERMIAAVKEWGKSRIYIGVDGLELSTGANYYLKDCKDVLLQGNVNVAMLQSSNVEQMLGSSAVEVMRDSSTVGHMWESSTVEKMLDSSTVRRMRGSSTVGAMCGNSIVEKMWDGSTVHKTFDNSTVYHMGASSTVHQMLDRSTVGEMFDRSTVGEIFNRATIIKMRDSSTVSIPDDYFSKYVKQDSIILYDNAVIKDSRTKTIYHSGDWKLVLKN